jgi:hypothetical protein
MGRPRRSRLRLGAILSGLAGVNLLVPASAGAAASEPQLQCPGNARATGIYDHWGGAEATPSPEEQAEAWRAGTAGARPMPLGETWTFRTSSTTATFGFADSSGRTVALLLFEKGQRGWLLVSSIECSNKVI